MNPPKCSDDDYINFVIATPRSVSATEAAKVQGEEEHAPAHDAFTRLPHRLEPDAASLWREAITQVSLSQGILVIDDSTLDKPYARKMELVVRHWSGKHHAVVSGINLITLLWTEGDRHVPVDYRIFDKKKDTLTKNDHFQAMLKEAHRRGFAPSCVAFDSWYSGLENLKLVRSFGWMWLTRLKSNRKVNPDREGLRAISEVEVGAAGRVVWLEGFGLIRVFKTVATNGDVELWATNKVEMSDLERVKWAGYSWTIENYHRGIKQFCLIERAQVRSRRAWRNHINLCLRAFLRLESHCHHRGISWYEAKLRSSGRRCEITSLIHSIRSSQLRNFYENIMRDGRGPAFILAGKAAYSSLHMDEKGAEGVGSRGLTYLRSGILPRRYWSCTLISSGSSGLTPGR